jgi:flavin reductase (DIM6/NTAB) family NADH-FMN oxidoreductase RutF
MRQKEVLPSGSEWKERRIAEFPGSPFNRIGAGWMLISSGDVSSDKGAWNTMTASWGCLGVLWQKNVAQIYIRKTRYTLDFANASAIFSLSFFDEAFRAALDLCGTHSGRDTDKAAGAGLTPIVFPGGAIGFQEAGETIVCRKLYTHDFDPSRFLDPDIDLSIYPLKDYHRLFIGEITGYLVREARMSAR